jgi:hypothetical protein
MPYNATFDANQFEPKQIGGGHPPGNKFPFEITNTEVVATKDNDGGMFVVEFSTPAGSIVMRYNLFNKSPKAVEIAHGQFSALCRAVGRYQVDFNNDGAVLRGARGLLDVGWQRGQEPSAEKPDGGYTEVKKVYDIHGIEPGKNNAVSQQQPQTQQNAQPSQPNQPMTQQPNGGWTQPQQGQPMTNQQPPQGWQQPQSGAVQQTNPQQNAQQTNPQGQAWQPGNAAPGGNPPWGSRT